MPITVTITAEHVNDSRRRTRKEIAGWLWAVRDLKRTGQHGLANFIARHAADYKVWAGARPTL